jgi:hypothetical protein
MRYSHGIKDATETGSERKEESDGESQAKKKERKEDPQEATRRTLRSGRRILLLVKKMRCPSLVPHEVPPWSTIAKEELNPASKTFSSLATATAEVTHSGDWNSFRNDMSVVLAH